MSENRYAWLNTAIGTFQIMYYPPDEGSEELGPTVMLYIPRPNQKDISFNLTALITEELDRFEEFINLLIAEARPLVAERDRIAHEALQSGDDSHTRVYRQVPQLIVRPRPSRKDSDSVHDGSENVLEGSRGDGDSSDGSGRDGDELADGESSSAYAEDDGETPY